MIVSKSLEQLSDLEKRVAGYFDAMFFNVINVEFNYWIAGGSIANKMTGNYSDFDFFFHNEEELGKVKNWLIDNGAKLEFESETAYHIKWNNKDIDLVRHYYSTPTDCISNFDFTVSMVAIDAEGVLYHHENFYEHLAHRALIINKITYPLSTFKRVLKYQKKGYHICNAGIQKIMQGYKDINSNTVEATTLYVD